MTMVIALMNRSLPLGILRLVCAVAVLAASLAFAPSALAAGGEPAISDVTATAITEDGARLEAQIDPQGNATAYEFWVESAVCTGGSATCERSGHPHKEEEGYIAAGSGSKTVTDDVTGLLSNTYFWYWIVAENLGGTAESSHSLFETGTASSGACPEGCHEEVPPYESKISSGEYEASKRFAEEAPARQVAREQAAKEQVEREAAARAGQPVTTATSSPRGISTGGVTLAGTGIVVQRNGMVLVKLSCLGIETCRGKLTLRAKDAAKVQGAHARDAKGKKASAVSIGIVSYSVAGDETKTVDVKLDAAGRALLSADRGRLSASLAILELAPGAVNTQTKTVHLVQEEAHGERRKK
jgi:hypothetical protein